MNCSSKKWSSSPWECPEHGTTVARWPEVERWRGGGGGGEVARRWRGGAAAEVVAAVRGER
jgi:hypothetical protein